MELAKVIGTIVSTVKMEELTGIKLLILQPIDANEQESGKPVVAVDTVQAGEGDIVSWVGGREAAMALEQKFVAVDAAIVSIVDQVYHDSR